MVTRLLRTEGTIELDCPSRQYRARVSNDTTSARPGSHLLRPLLVVSNTLARSDFATPCHHRYLLPTFLNRPAREDI